MPFNGSGSFSIVNTFIPNTTILSAAVNANFTDIATGLSDVLTRDGQAGMTAAFKAIAGSLAAPGISFTSDATSGLYLSTPGLVGFVSHSLGMLLNTNVFSATSATVQAGGSGYAVGDTITETGGTAILQPVFTVATLSGSAVATVTVALPGFYTTKPSNPVAQGSTSGAGTGCTLNITYNDPTSSDYRALFTDQVSAVLWQKFGASSFVSGIMAKANSFDYLNSIAAAGNGLIFTNNGASPSTISATISPTLVPNYISGLTLSTAGSSSTMSIAAGVANDTTNVTLMRLASAISKTTASWAVGTGNGGLDTGAIANATWYHFYLIERVDTAVVDVIFSTSASSPTLPANYTLFRRIGSGLTDGSAHWILFTQVGDTFIWSVAVANLTNVSTNANSARTSFALTVPTGLTSISGLMRATMTAGAGGAVVLSIQSLLESDQSAAGGTVADVNCATNGAGAGSFERIVNSSAQIAWRTSATGGNINLATYGWKDPRGRG